MDLWESWARNRINGRQPRPEQAEKNFVTNLTKRLTTKGRNQMKSTNIRSSGLREKARSKAERYNRTPVQSAIAEVKQLVLHEYGDKAGGHSHILRLALNEAEAVAWQSGFPQLFFPVLAAEKAKAAVSWHRRQHALRRNESENAFAE